MSRTALDTSTVHPPMNLNAIVIPCLLVMSPQISC